MHRVSRSGFYAWLDRPRSQRSVDDDRLGHLARDSFIDSDRTYGSRRVWRDVLAAGGRCGLHRVERLMREQALRARPRRRGLPVDRGERSAAPAGNVLDRQFEAAGPNQKWVADFKVADVIQRAAAIMSLLTTAKANGVDPHAWLTDVLTRLPTTLDRDIETLLPHRWKSANR